MAQKDGRSPCFQFRPSWADIVVLVGQFDSEYGRHTLPHSVKAVEMAWLYMGLWSKRNSCGS